MNKRALIILMLVLALVLTGCSSTGGTPAADGGSPAQATQAPANGFEKFREGNKIGVRKGGELIADAVWDSVVEKEIDGKHYFFVTLQGNPDREGLILENGDMVVEPTWAYLLYKGDHIAVGSMKGDTKNYHLIDMDTGKTILVSQDYVEMVSGDYAVIRKFGGTSTYGMLQISTGKKIGGFDFTSVPEILPGIGFLGQTKDHDKLFMSLSGKTVSSRGIKFLEKEGLILSNAHGGQEVYDTDMNLLGSFVVFGDGYRTEDGRLVFTGKTVLGGVQQDSLFFDATNKTWKVIPGAAKLHLFSDGMAIIENSDHRFGYIDDRGGIAYDYQFEDAEDFKNGQAQVVENYRRKTIEKRYAPEESNEAAAQAAPDKTAVYTPGRIVQLGNYYGDITWIVLDQKDGAVLLIAQNVLEYKSFHSYDYNKKVSADWASCSLRNWLNNDFIRSALPAVSGMILPTATGPSTEDKVFLLSKAEFEQYRSLLRAEPKYTAHAQEARKKHAVVTPKSSWWLLRDSTATQLVYTSSYSVLSSLTQTGYTGVRPAMWISLDALE
ncbi:MAG: WG repeat-containing protein [Clostridia bacterium]|nr:WG repeat-containing protein [Clostridia bacterium]